MAKTAEVNSQRIVQAVRRIAATVLQEDGPLDAAKPKARIGKTRGAAYYNSNGDIDSGEEVPAEADDPKKDEDSTTKKRDYQTISDDHQEGDTVDEVEAFDCTTGQKIQLDLAPEEGIEFVPPDGWDDPSTPPVPEGYISGNYYYNGNAGSASTPGGVVALFQAGSTPGRTYSLGGKVGQDYCIAWTDEEGYGQSCSQKAFSNVCGGSTEDYCTISPVPSSWPSDNIATLILKDGTFQAHDMDPDAAAAYKNTPPSSIEVCDGQGNRFNVSALENGRSMITKLNSDGSVPDNGHSLVIDRKGIVQRKIGNKVRDGYL